MKIRNGFVSNSSSASYIITVNTDIRNIIDLLVKNYTFTKREITYRIDASIDQYKEYLDNKSNKFNLHEILKELENYKQKIEELDLKLLSDRYKFIQIILEYFHITYQYDHDMGITEFTCGTSMHNSYNDIPNTMKEIIFTIIFNSNFKVKGRMIDDH